MNNYPYGNNQARDPDSTIPAVPFNPNAAQQQYSAPPQMIPPPAAPQPVPQPVMPPPQPVVPQPTAQQPYAPQPVQAAPSVSGGGFIKKNITGIIVSACGMASLALGIGGILESNNAFSKEFIRFTDAQITANNLTRGPSPALGLVMVILGLLFGAAAVVLGIIFSNKEAEEGSPRSTAFKVGMILGAVGVLLFLFAIFAASCSTCSFCSIKKAVS